MKSSIACALCGHDEVDQIADKDRHGNPLSNVLCQSCGLVWVDPRPTDEEISNFYAEDYRSDYKGAFEPKMKHCFREMHRANDRVARLAQFYKSGDKVFDIGAGAGFFSYVLRANNVDYQGVEPNEGYATFGRERLGLSNIRHGFLEDIEAWSSINIITINHVFEHLPNPNDALAHMRKLLVDDGLIIMEVPSSEAKYHSPDKVFHLGHLYWYSPETLQAMALKNGFEVVDMHLTDNVEHINIVLRKTEKKSDWQHLYADCYERIAAFYRRRSKLKHYLSATPYRRLFGKLAGYYGERQYVKAFNDKLKLIESVEVEKIG